MFEDITVARLPLMAKNPVVWSLMFLLAGLAWVSTLQQTLGMENMPMYGTMGMTLPPFLLFWTVMMAAMMLPALAPTVSVRVASLRRQTSRSLMRLLYLFIFLLGYLCIWGMLGMPIFVCCLGVEYMVRTTPQFLWVLGIVLFIVAGIYQFTPPKKRALLHCNPALGEGKACESLRATTSMRAQFSAGIRHGFSCLQCCGLLMTILLAVGLMNLFWMVLLTMLIFLEKAWRHGSRLSTWLGIALICYGLLLFISPSLLL